MTEHEQAARDLLPDARNDLDLTWEDERLDAKLTGILQRGMDYLDTVAGGAQDYGQQGLARALLMEYARYDLSGARSDFGRNYQAELLMLRMKQEVKDYVPDDTDL